MIVKAIMKHLKQTAPLIVAGVLVSACADKIDGTLLGLSNGQTQTLSESRETDLRSCLTEDAIRRIQDGSAFASPIRVTVKNMISACRTDTTSTENGAQQGSSEESVRQLAQQILVKLMNKDSGINSSQQ